MHDVCSVTMTAVLVLLAALLVAAGAQPAVLPGSDVNANYSAVCQTRYRFPAGYALGAWHAHARVKRKARAATGDRTRFLPYVGRPAWCQSVLRVVSAVSDEDS